MQTFEETGLKEEILKAITEMGFEEPTPIQQKTIPHLLNSKKDLIALAQTGTGKTAAFSLPVLQQIDPENKTVQTLILCPTRELCLQINRDIESYSKYLTRINVVPVYGGSSIEKQIDEIKRGAQIVVGTPGRVLDLINRRKLIINNIKWLILDEADEMLTMGFKDDLDTILSSTPAEKQTLLFSATMPKEILGITNKYMNNAEQITVGKRNNSAENISHQYYVVSARDRYAALKRIADINPNIYSIVFCRTRRETQEVADKLMQDGYNADALHGDLSQAQRDLVMGKFRAKRLQILVATDVAARGLDVNDLTHVINYNLPDDPEVYVHRSGRTGRAGKSGIAISLVSSREVGRIRDIERFSGKKTERQSIPTGADICEKQLYFLIEKLEKTEVNKEQIEEYLPAIYEKLAHLSREELIQNMVSIEFNRFLEYYKNARDLNSDTGSSRDRDRRSERSDNPKEKGRSSREGDENFSRFFINIGSTDSLSPARLLGLINEYTAIKNLEVGKIDVLKSFSFFECDKKFEPDLLKALNRADFEGKRVVVEVAAAKGKGGERSRSGERPRNGGFGNRERSGSRERSSGGGRNDRSRSWDRKPSNTKRRFDR